MPVDFSRRAFLQSLPFLPIRPAEAAARTKAKDKPLAGAPFIVDGGRILVDVAFDTPEGGLRKALAFFNMGMGRALLTKALHAELGLDRGAPLRYAAAGARFDIESDKVDVAKPDFTGLSFDQMFAPRKVEAMLSPSALLDRVVTLDYGRKILAIQAAGGAAPDGVAVPIRVNPQTGLASVDVDVDGASYPFVIDAGSGYVWMRGATLDKWLAKAPGWRRAQGAIGRANYNMLDFDFEKQGVVARLPQIGIGDVRLANVGVFGSAPFLGLAEGLVGEVFWDNWQKSAAGPVAGWLGANVLEHFRLTIDYPNRTSYWLHVSQARAPSLPLPRFTGEGTLAIDNVHEGHNLAPSPAKRGRAGEGDWGRICEGDAHDLDQPGVTLIRRDGRFYIGGIVRPTRGDALEGAAIGDELIGVGDLDARSASKESLLLALHGRPGETRKLVLRGAAGERAIDAPVLDMS